jgi:hypothetical protein
VSVRLVAVVVALLATTAAPAVAKPKPKPSSDIAAARAATAPCHADARTQAAGYGLLRDAAGIACIDHPTDGAMGIHFVNGTLVGDDKVDVTTPELLVYEPTKNGRLRLVAAEYVAFQVRLQRAVSRPSSRAHSIVRRKVSSSGV